MSMRTLIFQNRSQAWRCWLAGLVFIFVLAWPASGARAETPASVVSPSAQNHSGSVAPSVSSSSVKMADVRAFVDKSSITIGEKIKYTVEVETNKRTKVAFAGYAAHLGGLAVRDFAVEDPKRAGREKLVYRRWYVLDTYTVGSYVIPPQEVKLTWADGTENTLKSPEIFVEVKSVMSSEKEAGLHDIKPPLPLAGHTPRGVWILAGVLLAGMAAAGFLIFYRTWRAKASAHPPRPAHELAFEELNHIQSLDLIRTRELSQYYYLLSACLRRYLERRYQLRAPEQTTEEFLISVSEGSIGDAKQVQFLKQYLELCDLVKFARFEPPAEHVAKAWHVTRQFIEETKEPSAVPPLGNGSTGVPAGVGA